VTRAQAAQYVPFDGLTRPGDEVTRMWCGNPAKHEPHWVGSHPDTASFCDGKRAAMFVPHGRP
jgi:hypothetical protein